MTKNQPLINANHLAGVQMAIALHAPKHLRMLDSIFLRDPQWESAAKFAFELSLKDANAVLEALLEIEQREGCKAKFKGFQIDLLIAIWSECTSGLQVQDTPGTGRLFESLLRRAFSPLR